MNIAINKNNKPGMALLAVLLVVMIASLVSLSFISRSDVELSCGDNMITRTQIDYLAESGLHHAKGLILTPQDATSQYWTGDNLQQLVDGSNKYYDVSVTKLSNCNYQITSEGYQLNGAAKTSRTSLQAQVRIDPAIALWTGSSTEIKNGIVINGDAYCRGTLTGSGLINGDAFAKYGINISYSNIQGSKNTFVSDSDKPVEFPSINVTDFQSTYYIDSTLYNSLTENHQSRSGQTYDPSSSNPVGIVYCTGNIELQNNVTINGSLIVNGDLRISGFGNAVTAVKNFPAILVSGNLIIEQAGKLQVTGAVIVQGKVLLNESATDINIEGALITAQDIVPMTADFSNEKNHAVLMNSPRWVSGKIGTGALRFDGSNDYLVVQNSTSLQLDDKLSMAAWIKADNLTWGGNVNVIVRKGEYAPAAYQLCIADRRVALMLNNDDSQGIRGLTPIIPGLWYHVAATWDGDKIRLYVNGNLDRYSEGHNFLLPADNRDLYIGGRDGSDYFNGIIDDVQIYDNRKSDSDVRDIMFGQQKGDLVGRWKFDENGSSAMNITVSPDNAALQTFSSAGTPQRWSPAGGAFFKEIKRN